MIHAVYAQREKGCPSRPLTEPRQEEIKNGAEEPDPSHKPGNVGHPRQTLGKGGSTRRARLTAVYNLWYVHTWAFYSNPEAHRYVCRAYALAIPSLVLVQNCTLERCPESRALGFLWTPNCDENE